MCKVFQNKIMEFRNNLSVNKSVKENDHYNAAVGINNDLELKQVRFYIEDVNDKFGGSTHLLLHLMLSYIADFEKLSQYQIMRLFKIISDSLINWCTDMCFIKDKGIGDNDALHSLFDMYVENFNAVEELYKTHTAKSVESAYKYLIGMDYILYRYSNKDDTKIYTLDEVKLKNLKEEKFKY